MVIGFFVLAVITGYIRKGRLKNIVDLEVKLVSLFILSLLIQLSISLSYFLDIGPFQEYDVLLYFSSYIILFAALMGNFDNKWFILISIGTILNFIVIFLNGGKMPISYDAAMSIGINPEELDILLMQKAGTHQALQKTTILWFLSDIIPINFPDPLKFLNNIYSLGDLVMFGGIFGLIQSAMVDKVEEEEKHDEKSEIVEVDSSHLLEDNTSIKSKTLDIVEKDAIETEASQNTIMIKSEEIKAVKENNTIEVVINEEVQEKKEEQDNEIVEDNNDDSETISLEEVDEADEEEKVDTFNRFIIVNGKIRENPNYGKFLEAKKLEKETKTLLEDKSKVNEVKEIEMDKLPIKSLEEDMDNRLILDDEEIKERIPQGYKLVEVEVGGKKINFWQKDL